MNNPNPSLFHPFPIPGRAIPHSEERMRLWILDQLKCEVVLIVTKPKFAFEMLPFIQKLSIGFHERSGKVRPGYLFSIEMITPGDGFLEDVTQIGGNDRDRPRMLPKPDQLRVMTVARRPSLQHFLSQQCFPPDRNQSFCIEIPRMDSPQSQRYSAPFLCIMMQKVNP